MLDEDSRKADSDNDDVSSVASVPFTLHKPVVQIEGFKPTPMQGSFQSGSTPTHLSSRYMVSIRSFQSGSTSTHLSSRYMVRI